MKNRKLSALLAAAMVSATVAVPAAAEKTEPVTAPVGMADAIEIMPREMPVANGEINDKSGLDISKTLNKNNGKYVNFYVENLGSNPVQITINDENERILEAGEKGHISMEVTQGIFGADKTYKFKAVAGKNGGTVHINYVIYQRDVQS